MSIFHIELQQHTFCLIYKGKMHVYSTRIFVLSESRNICYTFIQQEYLCLKKVEIHDIEGSNCLLIQQKKTCLVKAETHGIQTIISLLFSQDYPN